MNHTPNANRIHIAVFGKRNAGKSSLLNALIGQEVSLVSPAKGTTTDPVYKAMELIPLGPVLFIDTAGLDDEGDLGKLRVQRTHKIFEKTDLALYVMDICDMDEDAYAAAQLHFKRFNIPFITVINKIDQAAAGIVEEAKRNFEGAVLVSAVMGANIDELKEQIIQKLEDEEQDPPIVGDLIPYNGKVVMVVPIDSEAPKGRIILPQVQLVRDCLDHGIKSYVVRDTELDSAIRDLEDIDLVVTDSQAFKKVNEIVPAHIRLTSFSILFARYKGDLEEFVRGIRAVKSLPEGANILISESCSHNHSHEDIGRVKIPRLLSEKAGKSFHFDFSMGNDFADDLSGYDLVIHCGSCMLNRKTMLSRIMMCREKGVPITNYGVVLAYAAGILDRAVEIFF